jgi:ubiquinone/menaquinone biosynthesis C-methylase UbiE
MATIAAAKSILACPQCRKTSLWDQPCACGFIPNECDGIIDLLTEADAAAAQPFLEIYERVRLAERWGGDDLDLPFHAKRHRHIWNIRQRTFRAFESAVANIPRGFAVDVGAGNCWLTRYLDRWGFDAIGIDLNTSSVDGLRAGQRFIDQGSSFLRVRASMERLPLDSDSVRLLTANASFHYACDFLAVLAEFRRVLATGGILAIIDTPFYENADDGERMVSQRVQEFGEKYGIAESLARKSSYLTYRRLEELAYSLNLTVQIRPVWPGLARQYQQIRGRLAGRRVAEFPLVLLGKK